MPEPNIIGNLQISENDSRRLLVGAHVCIAIKPKGDNLYINLEPSIPKLALATYSTTAAAYFIKSNNSSVMTIEDVEAEDVQEAVSWIIKTWNTNKPARLDYIKIIPIANNARKLDLAKKLGIKELQIIYTDSINYVLENKNVHAHDAQALYASHDPLSAICWQVAKNMAIATHNDYLSELEKRQYTRVQYQVQNLYDNIRIHLAALEKSTGEQ